MFGIQNSVLLSFKSFLGIVMLMSACQLVIGHMINIDKTKPCPSDPTLAVISRTPRSFSLSVGQTVVPAAPDYVKLVVNECRKGVRAYISLSNVHLTRTSFVNSTDPLTLRTDTFSGSVSDAVFVHDSIVLIVGGKLVRHNYVTGATSLVSDVIDVTDLISSQCCSDDVSSLCRKRNDVIVVYKRAVTAVNHVYVSRDGGNMFTSLPLGGSYTLYGGVISASYLSLRLLTLQASNLAIFLDVPYETNSEVASNISPQPFTIQPGSQPGTALGTRLMTSGLGSLLVWDTERLFYSPNGGLTVNVIDWYQGTTLEKSTAYLMAGETFTTVVSGVGGHFVAITSNGRLLYGREGFITQAVSLDNHGLSLRTVSSGNLRQGLVLDDDWLEVYKPDTSQSDSPIGMERSTLNLASHVAKYHSDLPMCTNYWIRSLDDDDSMVYVDKKQTMTLRTQIVNKKDRHDDVIVSVSNPTVVEVSSRYQTRLEGMEMNKRILNTEVREKVIPSSLGRKNETLVNVRVTGTEPTLTCRSGAQVVRPVTVGCPPNKRIAVVRSRNVTDCPERRQYSNTILGHHYDPQYLARVLSGNPDLTTTYDIASLGCPIMAYYNDRFIVNLTLFDGERNLGLVDADFVLYEIHGLNTYSYCQTGSQAGCQQSPQSWSHMLQSARSPARAWTRQNYCDCRSSTCSTGVADDKSSVEYQVLRLGNGNCLEWKGRNGIHVFEARIVDPQYSYCDLSTRFAVEVYGADAAADMQVMIVSGGLILFGLSLLYVVFIIVVEYTRYKSIKLRRQKRLEKMQVPQEVIDKIDENLAKSRKRVNTAASENSASTHRSSW